MGPRLLSKGIQLNLRVKFQKFSWVSVKFHENPRFSKIKMKFSENSRFSRFFAVVPTLERIFRCIMQTGYLFIRDSLYSEKSYMSFD